MIRASNSGVSASRQIATTWSILIALERSRAILANADALRSPARATRASDRSRAASWLITTATTNISAKVNMYCVSVTANESFGSTKKKSKQPTESRDAHAPARRPSRKAMNTVVTRKSMTTLERSKKPTSWEARKVAAPHASVAMPSAAICVCGSSGIQRTRRFAGTSSTLSSRSPISGLARASRSCNRRLNVNMRRRAVFPMMSLVALRFRA